MLAKLDYMYNRFKRFTQQATEIDYKVSNLTTHTIIIVLLCHVILI